MPANGTCVLVVDDEAAVIVLVQRSLERAGYTVFVGSDYDTAMVMFDAHASKIDLLLTNISLPGKTGIEIARDCLRKKPGLKALLMSGWVGAEFLDYVGIPKGDPHFLPKPFRRSTLLDRVRQVLASADQNLWFEIGNGKANSEGAGG